jgi:hypothetical protein
MSTGDQGKDKTGSRPSRRQFVQLGAVAVGGGLLAACGGGGDTGDVASLESARPATRMATPTLDCGSIADGTSQVAIAITVTAGSTGAPAGFSLQWMTKAANDLSGWLASDDPNLCKASFSGNANLTRYNLVAGESVKVIVGEFLFDNGASTNCDGALVCGTEYVFRVFAHANSTLQRSDFSSNKTCSTLPCVSGDGCTFTQGYWKTHGPIPTGNNTNVWPVTSLTLGTVVTPYTDLQLLSIFNTPAGGNGLIALAHQLIAAKLNIANGAATTDAVDAAIAAADALIGNLVIPPVGSGFLAPSLTSALTGTLASYNEGTIAPGGHCQ